MYLQLFYLSIIFSLITFYRLFFQFATDTKVERYGKINLTYPKCCIVGELDEQKIRLISQSQKNKKKRSPSPKSE